MNLNRIACFFLFFTSTSLCAENIVNVYTSRHYSTDKKIYKLFTEKTGIKVREISAKDQILLERLKNESPNSPADVLILADAARLWRASQSDYFQPYTNKLLNQKIPSTLRASEKWVGLTVRARIIVYDKKKFKKNDVQSYLDIGKPLFKGEFCSRSITHPYMLSLLSSFIINLGETEATKLAKKLVYNQARKPQGGDTDQIKAVGRGECGVAFTNSYYLIRLMRSKNPSDKDVLKNVGFVFPNQDSYGTHINVTGAGVVKTAPNVKNANLFLNFLTDSKIQAIFAEGNNEWPVVTTKKTNNEILENLGDFKRDNLDIEKIGSTQFVAQKIADKVGWQ
jgi:iron(III) transport system substrate-binding protein